MRQHIFSTVYEWLSESTVRTGDKINSTFTCHLEHIPISLGDVITADVVRSTGSRRYWHMSYIVQLQLQLNVPNKLFEVKFVAVEI